jgi:hypothetical protein
MKSGNSVDKPDGHIQNEVILRGYDGAHTFGIFSTPDKFKRTPTCCIAGKAPISAR